MSQQVTEPYSVYTSSTATSTCQNCGATNTLDNDGKCSNCKQTRTLETYDYSIRPATRGGGLLLFKQDEPIEQIKDSDTWLSKIVEEHKIPLAILKKAILKAKATPKKPQDTNSKPIAQIVAEDIKYITPDSGIIDGKPYMGLSLPCDLIDENGNSKRQNIYHLLFSDGTLIQGDNQTLAEHGLYLANIPFETKLRISKHTVLNLASLPKISPSKLFYKIIEVLKRHIEFHDQRYYPLTTYWIIGTYFHKQFSAYPYLFLNAVKNSGKTKLMMLLSLLCYNGKLSTNMSNASLFRYTQNNGSTILLDEADQISKERLLDLENLLNAGYKRGGASVDRTEPCQDGKYRTVEYDVYSPKAISNIKGLNNNVLESRTISIIMKRGFNKKITDSDIILEDAVWQQLRDELTRFYFQECLTVSEIYKQLENVDHIISDVSVISELSDITSKVSGKKSLYSNRVWECWKPLFIVAKRLFEASKKDNFSDDPSENITNTINITNITIEAYKQLLSVSVELIDVQNTNDINDGPSELSLIVGMLKIVTEDKKYPLKEIIAAASEYMDSVPGWFNEKWAGRAMKRLGFLDNSRSNKGVKYHLTPSTVQDIATRLGVSIPPDEPEPKKQTSANLQS